MLWYASTLVVGNKRLVRTEDEQIKRKLICSEQMYMNVNQSMAHSRSIIIKLRSVPHKSIPPNN